MPAAADVTLGLLAGGRATRLGGIDKAFLLRDGVPQLQRLAQRLHGEVAGVLASANRDADRHAALGVEAVPDLHRDLGPIGGLHALSHACRTPWLVTVPVDVVDVNDCLLRSLAAAGDAGAFAIDDDGPQPLVALWPVARLRAAVDAAIGADALAIHPLQRGMAMEGVRFAGFRFGNLNTPGDLAAAGIAMPTT